MLLWHQELCVCCTTCKDNTEQRARRENGGAEHEIVLLAKRNAQATPGSFDSGPLSDTPTVRGEVPQLVEQRVGGRALAAIRFHQEGCKVVFGTVPGDGWRMGGVCVLGPSICCHCSLLCR